MADRMKKSRAGQWPTLAELCERLGITEDMATSQHEDLEFSKAETETFEGWPGDYCFGRPGDPPPEFWIDLNERNYERETKLALALYGPGKPIIPWTAEFWADMQKWLEVTRP